jgi:hypothetical protein
MERDPFNDMALRNIRGESTEEEDSYLRSDENVEDWHRWLSDYILDLARVLSSRKRDFAGKVSYYKTLSWEDRNRARDNDGWERYKEEHFAFIDQGERLIVEARKRANLAKKLVKDLKRRRHLETSPPRSDNRFKAALELQTKERGHYRTALLDIRHQLLDVPEFFSDLGQPMRNKFLERVDETLHPKREEEK